MERLNLYFFGESAISTHDGLLFYGTNLAIVLIMVLVGIVNF